MTFPDKPHESIESYCDAYIERTARAGQSIDRTRLAEASRLLLGAFERGSWLFTCGNGGSAAIANHLLCDFAKGIQTDTGLLPRVVSLSANVEIITAIANDIEYADVFVYQLKTAARSGDILLTISSSGDSDNVVRALAWAKDNAIVSIALTGFSGGRSSKLATVNLHVEGDNYGVVEDTHQSIMHIFAQYLRQTHMSPDLVAARKF